MKYMRQVLAITCLIVTFLACLPSAHAQVTTGNVRGIIQDQNGAALPNAQITITSAATGASQNTQTTNAGEYQLNNLLVGAYTMTVEAPNFKTVTVNEVRVELNKTTDIPATQLTVGGATETVNISAGGAELVDTTTTNLSKQFNERQVVELAQSSSANGLGVYNLALISPNVSSSGGVGVGSGGSVGGQRARNNNFVVDGIDNNDKAVTGPQIYISPESVAEFSLLTNQYSAEFARSTGGQFNLVTKTGGEQYHGSAFGFFQNRKLNALDTLQKNQGITRGTMPRYDFDRFGGNFSGPLHLPRFGEGGKPYTSGKDKLFFFTQYENYQTGQSTPPGGVLGPTAAGFATLNSLPGLSRTNLAVFNQYIPVALLNNEGKITVGGVDIPVGDVAIPAPFFNNNRNFVLNVDYNQSTTTQHRGRFIYDRLRALDNGATLPQFFIASPADGRLFSYTLLHTFTPNLTNETRLAYRRLVTSTPAPNIPYPGLDQFPNIDLNDIGISIGPDTSAPQGRIENNYQIVNNLTYLFGKHSTKFGGDFRKLISPQVFVQRQRGEYSYDDTETFLRDISPGFSERNVGANTYYGDQRLFFAFAQDDWRVRPNFTLNLGLNYAYQEVPFGAKQQDLNAISSVPGLIEFRRPRAQKKNFGPRVGFAYSPNYDSGVLGRLLGNSGKTSIRAGFSMAYDVIFDNLYSLSSPPQFQQTIDVDPGVQNFLANGGIPNVVQPTGTDAAATRAATGTYIPDQQVPYAITFTGSVQRQFAKDYQVEVRYLHTRGVHLLTQNRLNRQSKVFDAPGGYLPTYLSAPAQSQLDALPVTLDQINARSSFVPKFAAAGFNQSNIVAFLSNGNSTYDGGSIQVQRRLSNGFQLTGAYTLSHLIDDSTAELFSTLLSPRRVQDFQNLRAERADSALDHRHRFVFSSFYTLPFFSKSSNFLARTLLGNLSFAGTQSFESGEKATIRSGVDANLNSDNAGDRAIVNVSGVPNTASTVTALRNSAGSIVAYLANNPNAQYIQTGRGALANAGRNTLQLPGINNLDFSVFKNFNFSETKRIQLRADFYNAFNHPQYTPGSVNGGELTNTSSSVIQGLTQIGLSPSSFNRPNSIFTSHPRAIQLALRFDF